MHTDQGTRTRKVPFATHIDFNLANLKEGARLVQQNGFKQVQFCSKNDRGLRAEIYASGQITLYSRCMVKKRPERILLGELGLITLEQARQLHRAYRLQAFQGKNPKAPLDSILTFSELHNGPYVEQCQSRKKKSLPTDQSRFKHWLEPEFGNVLLTEITQASIVKFVIKMQDAGLSPATVKKTIVQLSSCLALAVDLDLIPKNVAKAVKLPRVNNQRTEFLTVQQTAAFIDAARTCGPDEFIGSRMLMLLAFTGARLGECRAAQHSHMDLESGVWKLPTQKSGRPGVIHLSQAAAGIVTELSEARTNQYLFPGARGNDQLSRPIKLFKRLCRQAGIGEHWRIHDLRHGFCSVAINAGIPIEIVSHAARHSSPVVTRLYSHAHQDSLVAANEAVARLITTVMARPNDDA